jgi:hypothetical protein
MDGPAGLTPLDAMEAWNKWLPRQHLQLVPDDTKPY